MDRTSGSRGDLPLFYRPLAKDESTREVRFLRFVKTTGSKLEFELKIFSMDDEPEYKALSYCWTEAEATEEIRVNDCPFLVRPNLFSFLQQLSKEDGHWIFIDAICINQNNWDERSQQVRLMRDIYAGAAEVVVWLNCDETENRGFFSREDMARFYASNIEIVQGAESFTQWYETLFPRFFEARVAQHIAAKAATEDGRHNDLGYDEEAFALATPFLSVQYWKRTWIIQEISLARNLSFRWRNLYLTGNTLFSLVCTAIGTLAVEHQLEIESLGAMAQFYLRAEHDGLKNESVVVSAMAAFHILLIRDRLNGMADQRSRAMALHHALLNFSWHDCTLQRDKIFALLGLTFSVLRADYDMPKLELATRVIFECLLHAGPEWTWGWKWGIVVNLHQAILSAVGLDFDHPTVTVTMYMIFTCLEFHTKAPPCVLFRGVMWRLHVFRIRGELDSYNERSTELAIDELTLNQTHRLLRFISRYKANTTLLPVDGTGLETMAERQSAVVDVFMDVVCQMTIRDGVIPEGLPADSRLRSYLTSSLPNACVWESARSHLSQYQPISQQVDHLLSKHARLVAEP